MPQGECRHCHRFRSLQGRGLCAMCHRTPAIRELYPRIFPMQNGALDHEPTEAELDAMIEEQMRPENLPPWWDECESRQLGTEKRKRVRVRDTVRARGGK